MSLHSGYVRDIPTRDWQGKTFWSVKLSNGDLIGFGPKRPNCEVNDYVEVVANKNDKGYLQAKPGDIKVTAAPADNSVSKGASASSYVDPKEKYWLDKGVRDAIQDELRAVGASRNTAIEWIKFLVTQGAVPLPKKQADLEEALNLLLDDYTKKFRGDVKNVESVQQGDDVGKKEESNSDDDKNWA